MRFDASYEEGGWLVKVGQCGFAREREVLDWVWVYYTRRHDGPLGVER